MKASGHRFYHPMPPGRFWWDCVLRLFLWVPGQVHYILIRAAYSSLGGTAGPYQVKGRPSKVAVRFELVYLAVLLAALVAAARWPAVPFWVVPAALWPAAAAFSLLAPERFYLHTVLKPDVAPRWSSLMRLTYLTLLFSALAGLTRLTGRPWGLYYIALWLVPLGTAFSFFMMLREEIQHSNTGRGRLTNTRIYQGPWLVRACLFPLGMEYHLAHHVFPMVPHYRQRELHELLMQTEEYRRQVLIVEGLPPRTAAVPP
jgi:hypothetical protein